MRFSGKFERRFPVCLDRDFRLLKPIIDGRNLGVVVIAGEFRNIRGIPDRRIMVSSIPEAKMPQDLYLRYVLAFFCREISYRDKISFYLSQVKLL